MIKDTTLIKRARELRKSSTPAEAILWKELRGRRFMDFKFRRQHIVGRYFADFFCARLKLIVELDGESHVGNESNDEHRSLWLEREGYRVLRYWNPDIYEDKDVVLESIWLACQEQMKKLNIHPEPDAIESKEKDSDPPLPSGERG